MPMPASYPFAALDAPRELARLQAQVRLVSGMEGDFLDRIGLVDGQSLLDLGCGPGFFAEWVKDARLPGGRVIGVDADTELLAVGRARLADRVDLRAGSADAIPVSTRSVDVAYARFLFQHLSAPERALAELRRVTRVGGVVAVVDTDDGGLLLHPAPAGLDRLLSASKLAQAARGGDRTIGRKLKALLVDAGLVDVHVRVYPFTTEDVGPDAFVDIALGFKAGVLAPPFFDTAEAAELLAATRTLAGTPGFFGHALGYAAWGRVPP